MADTAWYTPHDLLAQHPKANAFVSNGPERVSSTPTTDKSIPEAKSVGFVKTEEQDRG